MTKAELIEKLSRLHPELDSMEVEHFVDEILLFFSEQIRLGNKVEIRDFGCFSLRLHKPMTGTNPRNGEPIHLPERRVAFFKPGKELRERVDAGAFRQSVRGPSKS